MKENKSTFLESIKEVVDDHNIVKKTIKLMERLLGPAINETGLTIQEYVRKKRALNQVEFLAELQKSIEKNNLKATVVPSKVMFPLLENVASEDDEGLKLKWRNLVLNGLKEECFDHHRLFVNILSQLSPIEAKILDFINSQEKEILNKIHVKKSILAKISIKSATIQEQFDLEEVNSLLILDNLERLNLIRFNMNSSGFNSLMGGLSRKIYRTGTIELSNLAHEFLRVCKWDYDKI